MSKRSRAKGRRDSDRCLIVTRTVNFNLEDDWQLRLYEATLDWPNFSGRVKRLLEAEIDSVMKAVFDLPKVTDMEGEPEQPAQQEEDYDPILQLFGRVI